MVEEKMLHSKTMYNQIVGIILIFKYFLDNIKNISPQVQKVHGY